MKISASVVLFDCEQEVAKRKRLKIFVSTVCDTLQTFFVICWLHFSEPTSLKKNDKLLHHLFFLAVVTLYLLTVSTALFE